MDKSRQRMINDMQLCGYSERTQESYLQTLRTLHAADQIHICQKPRTGVNALSGTVAALICIFLVICRLNYPVETTRTELNNTLRSGNGFWWSFR